MRRMLLVAALCLAMVVLVGCGTAVPELRGMTIAQAQNALRTAGFALGKVNYDEKAQGAQGGVVAQEPAAGQRAKSGSVVALTVAGPPPVPTPDLSGLDKTKAETSLVAVGLTLGTATESYDASVAVGIVASQTPAPRVDAPRGSAIAVVISKGPEPVAVPSVKGKTQQEAETLLESAGFKVKAVAKANAAKKGVVIAQSPVGGMAQPGSTVSITVSTGVQLVRAPNVVSYLRSYSYQGSYEDGTIDGEIKSVAASYCKRYGLKCVVVFQSIMASDRQTPRAGTMVPKGSTVRVYVGIGD